MSQGGTMESSTHHGKCLMRVWININANKQAQWIPKESCGTGNRMEAWIIMGNSILCPFGTGGGLPPIWGRTTILVFPCDKKRARVAQIDHPLILSKYK